MHWTICAINPEPSSETKETRFEKDLNGLRQRNIHYCDDIFWNLLLILFAPKKFPEPNNNANIIFFFYLVYLHRHNHSHLSHINLYTDSWWISSREKWSCLIEGLAVKVTQLENASHSELNSLTPVWFMSSWHTHVSFDLEARYQQKISFQSFTFDRLFDPDVMLSWNAMKCL